ncbi:MAG: hypothetical protein ACRDOZ_13330, partial [Nocardioides sp.]
MGLCGAGGAHQDITPRDRWTPAILARRCGAAQTDRHNGHVTTFYEEVGGFETFRTIVARFYEGVATDEVLRPLYPEEDL